MNTAVKIMLLLFVVFLATPTIVGAIKKNCDTSYFYSASEEEHAHKEVKASFATDHDITFVNLAGFTSNLITIDHNLRHDNISARIFIPPPEQV